MSNFAPGDEVVCVIGNKGWNDERLQARPLNGCHYVVREVQAFERGDGLLLQEIVNPPLSFRQGVSEPTFAARHFRPVKRESIELFRQMCTSKKPLVPVGK